MHNITKIKLFRILLRITYLPALLILYPLALLRKKSSNGLFFFLDRYSLGGAQRIHLDILRAIADKQKQVFFTRYSPNAVFENEFQRIPNSEFHDIHIVCDWLLFRAFSVHYYSFYINRHPRGQVFGANSTFFYDMLPFVRKTIVKTELLHNFTFGKKGMEFFGLMNIRYLTHRIVYDFYTLENIEKQYAEFQLDPAYLKRILFIEPGVDIPAEENRNFDLPLRIVCAGRGGPQKRVWLIDRIAALCLDQAIPVRFHFAGTLIAELSQRAKEAAQLYGEVGDPEKMASILANSDIALLTSAYEGFPMFIKESMAHGCIPLVTALPGNKTHIKNGENGLFIEEIVDESGLVKEAVEKITGLTRDRIECIRISREAYRYAQLHFNRLAFNQAYRALLAE
jgi:glycosyltransferase involved in cell wall biosynthesis